MDPRLKAIYDRELQHLESHAREFAESQRYRKIATRLGLGETAPVRDPFVEWLLEGFAYLSARVQLKLEQDFPRFTQNLLSVAHPQLTSPTPSMIVAGLEPDYRNKLLMDGPVIQRGTVLKARAAGRAVREVQFATGRTLRLWPIRVHAAEYLPSRAAVSDRLGEGGRGQSGVELTLAMAADGSLADCPADELDLFLQGPRSVTMPLFQALTGRLSGAYAVVPDARRGTPRRIPVQVAPLGLERDHQAQGALREADALLPYGARSHDGFRLLHEFFAFPERFLFIRLSGLGRAFAAAESTPVRLVLALDQELSQLRGRIDGGSFRPYCVPAVNLFPKEADDIRLTTAAVEHHVVADRGAPTDYEVHSVTKVVGRSEGAETQEFLPFFSTAGLGAPRRGNRFYAISREPRVEPVTARGDPRLGDYRGGEVYLSIVDDAQAPFAPQLTRLSISTLCTNRHLPLLIGGETSQLTSEEDLGCDLIRVEAGPSAPRAGIQQGHRLWDAVSHLSLNYLSLVDTEEGGGAAAMRQLLGIYAPEDDVAAQTLVNALASVRARQSFGRISSRTGAAGGEITPITYGRGLEIELSFESDVEAVPLLAAVLDRFLASYVSVNSFTQTVLIDSHGQERCRWPMRSGMNPVL